MSGTLKIGGKTLATHVTTPSGNEISFHSDVMATTAQVQGVHTTATTARATNANQLTSVTAVSGYSLADLSVGDYVTGEGIRVGTTVSAISGTTITLYHPDGGALSSSMTDLSGDPVSFYNSTKALSPGTVAGALCRAWVNFSGTSQTIRAAYNVSSISYATGDYTVNFVTAMPHDKYVVVGTSRPDSSTTAYGGLLYIGEYGTNGGEMSTSSFRISTVKSNSPGSNLNSPYVLVAVFC
jgi:hypothetical protein